MNIIKFISTILMVVVILYPKVCFCKAIFHDFELETVRNVKEVKSIACNNGISISLATNCEANIHPDIVLEGSYPDYNDFEVLLFINNQQLPTSPVANGSHIGALIRVKVTQISTGNRCWSSIIVSDRIGPTIDCGMPQILTCLDDPNSVLMPTAMDGCDPNPAIQFVREQKNLDPCGVSVITRTYRATDFHGNISQSCDQVIQIGQAIPKFPEDITWTCAQYESFPNIISPTVLHACLTNPSLDAHDDLPGIDAFASWTDVEDFDVPLRPDFDDNFDNPLTDSLPNILDNPNTILLGDPIFNTLKTPTTETDRLGTVCNLSLNYSPAFLTFIDSSTQNLDTFKIANFLTIQLGNSNLEGLEDADILAQTGSGKPNVQSTDCPFNVTYADEKIETCPGADQSKTFKILRTWTVFNWCTNEILQDIQVIKVIDKTPPSIVFDNFNFEINVNESVNNSHSICASSGRLDMPLVFDRCSGIDTIRVFTPVGEGQPVFDGANNIVGFDIPFPYLERGFHDITYSLSDNCGNLVDTNIQVQVVDKTPPVAICRSSTQVSLNSSNITTLPANNFDEGSFDNCGQVFFKIRRINACSGFSDDENFFNDRVNFCCEDIGDTIEVMVRIYDANPGFGRIGLDDYIGNANECTVQVFVNDRIRPDCIPPSSIATTCDQIPENFNFSDTTNLNQTFGFARSIDNCGSSIIELPTNVDFNNCGVGTITRNFRAVDIHGNTSVGTCRQLIQVQDNIDYQIFFPDDHSIDCSQPFPDTLSFVENGCDILAVNSEDRTFLATFDGACRKILRTYRIVNWCEYDGFSQPTKLIRQDANNDGNFEGFTLISDGVSLRRDGNFLQNSTGFYEYIQHIKVFDSQPPVVSPPANLEFCGGEFNEINCTGMVRLMPDFMDSCTPDAISVTWQLDLFNDGNFDLSGSDSLVGRHPLGEHLVSYEISDDCGNTSKIDFAITIIDCNAPTPVCHSGISIELNSSGSVGLWATDLNASSFDFCQSIKFRLNRITDQNNDGFITEDDYLTLPPTNDSVQFTCISSGSIEQVQLWVGEVSNDQQNNWDFCTASIEIQDNFNTCPGSRAQLGGIVKMENGRTVSRVEMALSGNQTQLIMTPNNGEYIFDNLPSGDDFTVTPIRDDVHNIGISTLDLVLIQKHVLNVEFLNSPYKIIAADANLSQSITTLDVVMLQKMVLRVSNTLPNGNTAWRFVTNDHIFPNPIDPWETPFEEAINVNNLAGEVIDADFIAIKVGDVTLDVNPNTINTIEDRSFAGNFLLQTQNQFFKNGDLLHIPISAQSLSQVGGMQVGFYFDENIFEFVDVKNELLKTNNFGLNSVTDGFIHTSWINSAPVDEAVLFTLVLKAKNNGKLSNYFGISEEKILNEAYNSEFDLLKINLDFTEKETHKMVVTPNYPNPFSEKTSIEIELPESAKVQLKIFDTNGKFITQITKIYAEGKSTITIPADSLTGNGLYLYQLIWGNQTEVGRMIKF